jgi:diacylglycerol kinase family enzyme
VGEIAFTNNGVMHKRYFVNIVGFGFDALVATKANALKNKGISGLRVYIQSLASSYLKFRAQTTDFQIDNNALKVNLFSASIGIGKFNGGGMMQVPEANPVKGLFHITIIRKIGIWGILKNFKGLYSGEFIRDRRVSTHTGKQISIKSSSLLPGEADGESLGNAAFQISIIPHKLRVIYGSDLFLK